VRVHSRENKSTMTSTAFLPATEHARAIRERSVAALDLTELYISRIARHNPALHAIVIGNEPDALTTARVRDEDLTRDIFRGPLHGVAVTVKEAFNMTGLKTTVNFEPLKKNVASTDAYIVTRVKEAGAIILGKTNIPTMLSDWQSFGPLYPTANNPYDLTRTPGGSTGGGAAAVAAGLTTLEIGSDIGGSIRVPAHFCGVFGLKPTENMMMHGEGHVPPAPSARGGFVAMASVGPLARTMADVELAWSIINEPTWKYFLHCPTKPAAKHAIGECRVAWFDDVGLAPCGEETRRVLSVFLRLLEGAGVTVEKRPYDERWLDEAYAVWGTLFGAIVGQDAPWIVRKILGYQFGKMGRHTRLNLLRPLKTGLALGFKDFSFALRRRTELVQELQRRFDEYDFIVSPVAAGPAFPHNHKHRPIPIDGSAMPYLDYTGPFVAIYNACGNPVLVVPAGQSASGLPIGLQIAAPHYAEQELIQFGKWIEQLGVTFVPPAGY
jgi:amidase